MTTAIDTNLEICIKFIRSIGIEVVFAQLSESFLPGIHINEGKLFVDPAALAFPGDILHEAGHIAVVPLAERQQLNAQSIAERPQREAEEMMAIAWSYAACRHLGLSSSFLFHEGGYKGGGAYLAENFDNKRYIGLPMLQYCGLCFDEKNAALNHQQPYPYMQKWTR